MHFLADMGISLRVVDWLRGQGHDAKHVREVAMQRATDPSIFTLAIAEQRIVLTFDLDFSEIAALAASPIASVIIFRLRDARAAHVVERLAAVLPGTAAALQQGAIVTIEESRYRIRALPIGERGQHP